MHNQKISIIIVTWNTAKITHECVTSIKKYLNPNNYEIIIVDNNSTDNTNDLFSKRSDIKYIKNNANLGFSKANNIGSSLAKYNYLLFLNSDMVLVDDSLNNMVDYYSNHRHIGLIGPQLLNPDLTPQASVFPPQTLLNAFRQYWLKQPSTFSKYIPPSLTPSSVWSISGGAILINRQLFTQLGGWNEQYYFYFEDLDLCRSIKKLGLEIIYFPETKIIHHHGASGKNITKASDQWRRLIPGSITYHGYLKHTFLSALLWLGQKL